MVRAGRQYAVRPFRERQAPSLRRRRTCTGRWRPADESRRNLVRDDNGQAAQNGGKHCFGGVHWADYFGSGRRLALVG